ncbi:MAG: hypothetical protein ACRDJC_20780 [Thermomicrobiales bacterium]
MPPQSPDQTGPEQSPAGRPERRASGRAQRKLAAEQAAHRRQWWIAGGTVAAVLLVALVYFLATRPREAGSPVLAAEAMPPTIPVAGSTMGPADAPVTIVEWGDYT